jgi:hypothetical protein
MAAGPGLSERPPSRASSLPQGWGVVENIASRLAPTGLAAVANIAVTRFKCGSEPARDGNFRSTTDFGGPKLGNRDVYLGVGPVRPRLHHLAPLPTTTPESAGLCALGLGYIVFLSLTHQRSGLAARHHQGTPVSPFEQLMIIDYSALWRLCVGHFGAPGSLMPGLLTRVQPPPSSFSSDG